MGLIHSAPIRLQTKQTGFISLMKVFANALAHFLFSKGGAVECRQLSKESPNLCYAQNSVASSRSAEREIIITALFFFVNWFMFWLKFQKGIAKRVGVCYNDEKADVMGCESHSAIGV